MRPGEADAQPSGAPPPPAEGFSAKDVRACIIAVEEVLQELGKVLAPEAKADLIVALLELDRAERAQGRAGVSGAEIIRLVRRAA